MVLKKPADGPGLHTVEPREYPRDAAGLLAQLGDADPGVRRWAARDLAAHPAGASALCARLAVEPDASVRAVIFSSVAQLGGATVVEGMLELLRSEQAGLRNGAIEVLAGLPQAVAPHIGRLLQDADDDVRIFTVNLLAELRHPEVPKWLAQVLTSDPAINVVGAAIDALVEAGGAEALPALRSARARFADDEYIRFSAELATQRIGSA